MNDYGPCSQAFPGTGGGRPHPCPVQAVGQHGLCAAHHSTQAVADERDEWERSFRLASEEACTAATERDAARREIERLRAACDALLPPLYRLLGMMEIDNHDAQMDALLDVREPFRRWREALSSESQT